MLVTNQHRETLMKQRFTTECTNGCHSTNKWVIRVAGAPHVNLWRLPKLNQSGWWFQPLWKILVSWDDYSQYMGKKCSKPPISKPINHQNCTAKQTSDIGMLWDISATNMRMKVTIFFSWKKLVAWCDRHFLGECTNPMSSNSTGILLGRSWVIYS